MNIITNPWEIAGHPKFRAFEMGFDIGGAEILFDKGIVSTGKAFDVKPDWF